MVCVSREYTMPSPFAIAPVRYKVGQENRLMDRNVMLHLYVM